VTKAAGVLVLLAVVLSTSQTEAAVQLGQVSGIGIAYCGPGTNTVQLSTTSGTPYVVPDGGGVITRWQRADPGDVGVPGGGGGGGAGALQIWRPSGGANFEFAGRSEVMSFAPGVLNDFATRIPVGGGEVLGLRTTAPTNDCAFYAGTRGDNVGYESGTDPLAGDFRTFFILPGDPGRRRLNVSATLEPDADRDGFGDETQDRCALDPSTQEQCETDPPQTKISKAPQNKIHQAKASYLFTSDEPRSTFECSIAGPGVTGSARGFTQCESPRKYRHLDEGRYKFKVRATDAVGNIDPTPAKDKFKVVG
jgi:hypothetical protein